MNCLNCGDELSNPRKTYCNNSCQGQYQIKVKISEWLEGKRTLTRKMVRKWLVEEYGDRCNICGITEWQGKPITLWVDHIDGNATNNDPNNFQLVCPNCDSQQPTFGAKNWGKGRKSRGLPQYG